jgi:hypothetical protein
LGLGPDIFARRRIDVIHGEIVGPYRQAKCDRWKITWLAFAFFAQDEWNDGCTHAHTSHTAMASKPASASDIR